LEIELKYKIHDKSQLKEIMGDSDLKAIEEKGSHEEIYMKAAYFDTKDGVLSKNDIAFRVRMEGVKVVGTLKWNDSNNGGLYTREEINVPINSAICFLNPDPAIFKESDMGKDLLELLNGRPLCCVLEMKFLRNRRRIDTGKAICELSLDEGEIITDYGNAVIREMEIELYSGEQSDMIRIGQKIAGKYGLEPELESKYARGLKLIEGEKNLNGIVVS